MAPVRDQITNDHIVSVCYDDVYDSHGNELHARTRVNSMQPFRSSTEKKQNTAVEYEVSTKQVVVDLAAAAPLRPL